MYYTSKFATNTQEIETMEREPQCIGIQRRMCEKQGFVVDCTVGC